MAARFCRRRSRKQKMIRLILTWPPPPASLLNRIQGCCEDNSLGGAPSGHTHTLTRRTALSAALEPKPPESCAGDGGTGPTRSRRRRRRVNRFGCRADRNKGSWPKKGLRNQFVFRRAVVLAAAAQKKKKSNFPKTIEVPSILLFAALDTFCARAAPFGATGAEWGK